MRLVSTSLFICLSSRPSRYLVPTQTNHSLTRGVMFACFQSAHFPCKREIKTRIGHRGTPGLLQRQWKTVCSCAGSQLRQRSERDGKSSSLSHSLHYSNVHTYIVQLESTLLPILTTAWVRNER